MLIDVLILDDDGQIIIMISSSGDTQLAIRQPYLEGMLPYEYAVILKALKALQANNINIYFEASSISDTNLNGHVHRVSHYFNKRFFKYTETGRDYHAEVGHQISSPDEEQKEAKSLFISEGNLLPSKTELSLAKKGMFDLYTITNLSLMDISEYLTMRPNLFAVTKSDLGNQDELVSEFSNPKHFQALSKFELLPDEISITKRNVELGYSETFDVVVSRPFHK